MILLAEAFYNLGNELQELGQLERAVDNYRRALEINPGYAEAHSNLGNVLRDLGQLDEAVASYLDEQQRFAAMVKEGRADIRNGRTLSHEEVERLVGEWERAGQ